MAVEVDALELFHIMAQRNLVGYLQNNVVEDANELFDIMPERFTTNMYIFFCNDHHD